MFGDRGLSLAPVARIQGVSMLLAIIASFHAPMRRHRQMKIYFQSSPSAALRINSAKQSLLTLIRLLRACGPRNDNQKTLVKNYPVDLTEREA